MREFSLERSIVVRESLEEVYKFFSEPANLQELTPPWLDFRVVGSSTEGVEVGTTIDYRLKVRGLTIRWRSLISAWNPPHSFVDEQLKGPYRMWHHTHTFLETEEGVHVGDKVRYAVPGGPLFEGLIERLFVGPDVRKIFDYRVKRLGELFSS
jgi:ligand-binding SRPBCC domain-containing protein